MFSLATRSECQVSFGAPRRLLLITSRLFLFFLFHLNRHSLWFQVFRCGSLTLVHSRLGDIEKEQGFRHDDRKSSHPNSSAGKVLHHQQSRRLESTEQTTVKKSADDLMMPFSEFNFPHLNWPVNFNGSTLSQGSVSTMARLLIRLQEKRCLTVAVFGGSVSVGSSLARHKENGIIQPRGKEGAWPSWLKKYLDVYFPTCGDKLNEAGKHPDFSGGHTVHNLAVPAVASDFWVVKMMEVLADKQLPNDFGAHLMEADLIIIDTSVNDAVELGKRNYTSNKLHANRNNLQTVQVHTEVLINQLNALPNAPAILFVGVSERDLWDDRAAKPNVTKIAEAQAKVAAFYGIPYLSAIHALGPFESEHQQNWFLHIFRADGCCHLSTVGHRFVASLIMRHLLQSFLDNALHAATNGLWPLASYESTYEDAGKVSKGSPLEKDSGPRRPAIEPPAVPFICTNSEINQMLHANPLSIDATKQKPVYASANWSVHEDVRGKPGLISFVTGSTVIFGFDAAQCAERHFTGTIKLQLLKSYVNMGVVGIRVYSVPGGRVAADCLQQLPTSSSSFDGTSSSTIGNAKATTSFANNHHNTNAKTMANPRETSTSSIKLLGGEHRIDCLWEEKASVTVVETLEFPATFEGCLCINATVISAREPHNKVKLLYLTVL